MHFFFIFFHFPRVAHYKKKSFPPFYKVLVSLAACGLHFIQTIFLKGRQMSSVADTKTR